MKNFIIITRNSKILSLLFFLFAAALVSGQVAAQKITLDGDCEIPLSGPVTIDLLSGDIIAASVSGIPSSCTDGSGGEGGTAPTVSFTVNGSTSTTVTVGTAVSAVWSSSGANSCAATGGWTNSGWNNSSKALSGSQSLGTGSAVPNIYTLSLACTNSAGTTTRNRSVTIVEASTGDCSTRPTPNGMLRDTSIIHLSSATTTAWESVYGDVFPSSSGSSRIAIKNNRYAALAFNTNNLPVGWSGRIHFDIAIFSFEVASPLVVVSECPGDFGPQQDARCRQIPVLGSIPFRWAEVSAATGSRCPIERSKSYYLNMVPTDQILNTSHPLWICNGSTSTSACGSITKAD